MIHFTGIENDTFDDENEEVNATEVVEFDEHAKQIIDDNIVEVLLTEKIISNTFVEN